MQFLTPLIFVFFLTNACNSPMNNRIRESKADTQNNLESLSLGELPYQITTQWLAGPIGNKAMASTLLIFITDEEGKMTSLADGLKIQFAASMPHMAHPIHSPGVFHEIETGLYINKSIHYNMPGEWLNEIQIKDQQGQKVDGVKWSEFL